MDAVKLISILQAAVEEHGKDIKVGLPDGYGCFGASVVEGAEVRKCKESKFVEERDNPSLAPYYIAIF